MPKMKKLLVLPVLILVAVLSGLTGVLWVLRAGYKRAHKPNIVIIVFDSLRADHLGCYGYPKKTSPHIDSFAQESALFENAVAVAPKTALSIMSLFTALTPPVHGVYNRGEVSYQQLSENILTLPVLLKRSGYFTAGFVQQGNLSKDMGFGKGFTIYRENCDYVKLRDWIKEVAVVIGKSRAANKPLFLFVHTNCTHIPYSAVSPNFATILLEKRVEGLPVYGAKFKRWPLHWAFLSFFDLSKPDHLKHLFGLYDSAVYYNDYIFTALQDLLKEAGLYDDAIIIILGDHGEEFFEHKSVFHARLFVETLHVPLIIKFPLKRYAGLRIPDHVSLMDITPALLDFLGAWNKPVMQGSSFLPLLSQKGVYRPFIISYSADKQGLRFIENGFAYSNMKDALGSEFLFDIKNDPFERNNIVKERPDIARNMRDSAFRISEEDKRMARRLRSVPKTINYVDRKAAVSELKALGYLQ